MTLRLRGGGTLTIGREIARGAQGVVHEVRSPSHLVYKRLHNPTADYQARLEAMLARPPREMRGSLTGHLLLAWPSDLAFDGNRFIGFVMPRIDVGKTAELHMVANPSDRRAPGKDTPGWVRDWTWAFLLQTASNLAHVAKVLHDDGYVIGDFNDRNILVWQDARVTMVDCDSMQVKGRKGKHFLTRLDRPEFTAPELVRADRTKTVRKPSSDLFGLAVHIYQLLMEGAHPFDGVLTGAGDKPKRHVLAQRGHFVYAREGDLSAPPGALAFDFLPQSLQVMFTQAFVTGVTDPDKRPDGERWRTALDAVAMNLQTCRKYMTHRYANHHSTCPWCARSQPNGSTQPRQSPRKRTAPAGTPTTILAGARATALPFASTRPKTGVQPPKQPTPPPRPTTVQAPTRAGRDSRIAAVLRSILRFLGRYCLVLLAVAAAYLVTASDAPIETEAFDVADVQRTVRRSALLIEPTPQTPDGVSSLVYEAERAAVWLAALAIAGLVFAWRSRYRHRRLGSAAAILAILMYLAGPWGVVELVEEARIGDFMRGAPDGSCPRGVDSFRPAGVDSPSAEPPEAADRPVLSFCPSLDSILALRTNDVGTTTQWEVPASFPDRVLMGSPWIVVAQNSNPSSSDHTVLGLHTDTGDTAWTFPYPVESSWYFWPGAAPEAVSAKVSDVITTVERDTPGTSDAVAASDELTAGDPVAARALLEQQYGLPAVDGRLLLLIADGEDPGTLVLLEPIFGEVVAAVSADP